MSEKLGDYRRHRPAPRQHNRLRDLVWTVVFAVLVVVLMATTPTGTPWAAVHFAGAALAAMCMTWLAARVMDV